MSLRKVDSDNLKRQVRRLPRWAMRVAHARTQLGTELRLKPVVLHLADKDGAALLDARHPELALFAAWAMQHRHGREAVRVGALELTDRLPRALRQRSSVRFFPC